MVNLVWILAFAPWPVVGILLRFGRFVVGSYTVAVEFRTILPILWLGATAAILLVVLAIARVEVMSARHHQSMPAAGAAA
jgi:hypothetical protein